MTRVQDIVHKELGMSCSRTSLLDQLHDISIHDCSFIVELAFEERAELPRTVDINLMTMFHQQVSQILLNLEAGHRLGQGADRFCELALMHVQWHPEKSLLDASTRHLSLIHI